MRAHKCRTHAQYRRAMKGGSRRQVADLDKQIRRENRRKKETK